MGKYQLDDKGKRAVNKFHEKEVSVSADKNAKIAALRKKHREKTEKLEKK